MALTFCVLCVLRLAQQPVQLQSEGLAGYINATMAAPPQGFGYGVSLYSAAWPLLERPVADFQIGLCSTWILPDNDSIQTPLVPHGTLARDTMPERGPSFRTVFQTIEGGLGYWASNRYIAPSAKFRMNGTPDGYNHELSTPGWEFSGKPLPGDQMGIAQLSNRVLIPPDGVTLRKETCGELFGYAWMALPLVSPHQTPVPTGNQCWTSFFNTQNFRGPVAFYVPSAWSRMSQRYPPAVGRGMDARFGQADSGAIEINTVPQFVSQPVKGVSYAKIPQLQFPVDRQGRTVLMQDVTIYAKSALWNQVAAWKSDGPAPEGRFKPSGAFIAKLRANPLEVRNASKPVIGVDQWVKTADLDPYTFGLEWRPQAITAWRGDVRKGLFPSYFRREGETVRAVEESAVPDDAGLKAAQFPAPDQQGSYRPSENGDGVWKHPGPSAGPFRATLDDGSVVTYYWYRFIDQPSMQNAGLSDPEKAKLQALVENIQRHWTPRKQYLPPPSHGKLASIDPAELVRPPKGMEIGYVPIAVRQDPARRR